MRRKIICSTFIVFFLGLQINTVIFADEGSPFLSESEVDIEVDNNNNYIITQNITISNIKLIEDNEIMHTLSNINNVKIDGLVFETDNRDQEVSITEKDSLKRFTLLIPENQKGNFNYQISYNTQLNPDEFTIPLFVPEFSSLGKENVVTINFKAPENMVIQSNSFPIVNGETGNQDTSYLMNLPSHVKYVFDDDKNYFNSFNLIGWGSLLVFGAIVFVWVRSERKLQKGEV